MLYELDERLRPLYFKNPLIHNIITSATIQEVSETEMHIRIILALAEANEQQFELIRKIHETSIVSVIQYPTEPKEG